MDNGGTRRIRRRSGSYLAGSCVRVFLSRNKGDGAWRGKKEGERERGKWRVGEEEEEENRVGGSIGAVFKRAHANQGTNGRARVTSTSLAALGRNEDGGMEVAVACATPRAGFERTLNFLPCPVFFFFFLISSFPPPPFFSSRYSSIGSLSLSCRCVSTISNNSVDYELSIFGSRRS